MYYVILLISGICMALMTSLNGGLANYLNVFEVSFFVHVIGAIILIAYIKLIRKEKITFKGVPSYVYSVGFIGVTMVATSSLCASHIGAALTMSLSIAAQLAASAAVDHFGLLGVRVVKFNAKRLAAYMIIALGLFLMMDI